MLRVQASRLALPLRQARGMATKVELPDFDFDYSALEPAISGRIMELHHSGHHKAYVTAYNKAAEQLEEAEHKNDVAKIIQLQPALKFNGGGHINHSLFWKMLTPPKDFEAPSGALEQAIEAEFGALDALISRFNDKAAAVQGSGWGWLAYSSEVKQLVITTTANQDPLQPTTGPPGLVPLLGIDMWEHAYYLQYQNKKADYLKTVWDVVNWKDVGRRYSEATGAK